jgi:hypothetical protein
MSEAAVPEMDPLPSRTFSLGDAMILILALALGLGLARPNIILIANYIHTAPNKYFQTLDGTVSLGRSLNLIMLFFLYFLLPAFLILRLRRPRPPMHSLVRQPGFAACAAPVACCCLATLPLSLLGAFVPVGEVIALAGQILLAAATPLAWFFLAVTGRWAAEPSWIDRSGRILGALSMVSLPAHLVLILLCN